MSGEVLREAARLMRDRAGSAHQGDWYPYLVPEGAARDGGEWIVDSETRFICSTHYNDAKCEGDAAHIASWHPVVAIAVADWLDAVAARMETRTVKHTHRALAVARAYLGTTTTEEGTT